MISNITKTLIRNHIKDYGYDGLVNTEKKCFCELDNLFSKCRDNDFLNCDFGIKTTHRYCNDYNCEYWTLTTHCYCLKPVKNKS